MAWITVLRDGETLGQETLQQLLAADVTVMNAPSGVGTGYTAGQVARMNGRASIAQPNHFFVTADGTDRILTVQPGIYYVQKDAGLVSYNPRVYIVMLTASTTITIPANASGTSRTDTVCLRLDVSTAPDATGTNLPTIVAVAGGASNALANAPADSPATAIYVPLCKAVVANGATSLSSGNLTDVRLGAYFPKYKARMYQAVVQSIPNNTFTVAAFDTVDFDPNGDLTTGAGAKYTCPVSGTYLVTCGISYTASAVLAIYAATVNKNAVGTVGFNVASGATNTFVETPASIIITAVAGDVLQMTIYQGTGGALNTNPGSGNCYFVVQLLSIT